MDRVEGTGTLNVRIRRKAHRSADGGVVEVLRDLDLALRPHAFTCLIGPSGCGKTTTLRIIGGLDTDFSGEIDPRLAHGRLAFAFQEPRLLPWRTVAQNVALALPKDADREERTRQALADVELEAYGERFPAQLSLGQARRAALARAFAVRPDVLLLDEPFVSLDEASAQRLRALLVSLWQRYAVTVLMVTHNVREAVQLADTIVLLSERPAHVEAVVPIDLPRDSRSAEAVGARAAELAARYPKLVAL